MNASTNLYCDFEANIIEGRGRGPSVRQRRWYAVPESTGVLLCSGHLHCISFERARWSKLFKKMKKC